MSIVRGAYVYFQIDIDLLLKFLLKSWKDTKNKFEETISTLSYRVKCSFATSPRLGPAKFHVARVNLFDFMQMTN